MGDDFDQPAKVGSAARNLSLERSSSENRHEALRAFPPRSTRSQETGDGAGYGCSDCWGDGGRDQFCPFAAKHTTTIHANGQWLFQWTDRLHRWECPNGRCDARGAANSGNGDAISHRDGSAFYHSRRKGIANGTTDEGRAAHTHTKTTTHTHAQAWPHWHSDRLYHSGQ